MQPIDAKGPLLVQGWAAVSAEKGIGAEEVIVALLGDDGNVRAARARVEHPEMSRVGFEAVLDTDNLNGIYKLQIYVRRQNQFFSCPITVQIRR